MALSEWGIPIRRQAILRTAWSPTIHLAVSVAGIIGSLVVFAALRRSWKGIVHRSEHESRKEKNEMGKFNGERKQRQRDDEVKEKELIKCGERFSVSSTLYDFSFSLCVLGAPPVICTLLYYLYVIFFAYEK